MPAKNALSICELASNIPVNDEVFILSFFWKGPAPQAGQFFMIKPLRSSVFLPRPISVFEYSGAQSTVKFLIAKMGKGTEELSSLQTGEKVQLTGPFGNSWADFLPDGASAALVGGGLGVAPLAALSAQMPDYGFHFYAGFRNGFNDKHEENAILGGALYSKKIVVAAEDGKNALNGRIVDFIFEIEKYDAVLACGPFAMLRAIKKKCDKHNVPCFLSLESRMACGVGACLGCTIRTLKGNVRCCTQGPIFASQEINFDE